MFWKSGFFRNTPLAENIFIAPASAGFMASGRKGYAIRKDSCWAFTVNERNKSKASFFIETDNVTPLTDLELKLQKLDQM